MTETPVRLTLRGFGLSPYVRIEGYVEEDTLVDRDVSTNLLLPGTAIS